MSMFFFDGGECACVSTAGMVCVVVHARGDDDVRSGACSCASASS